MVSQQAAERPFFKHWLIRPGAGQMHPRWQVRPARGKALTKRNQMSSLSQVQREYKLS